MCLPGQGRCKAAGGLYWAPELHTSRGHAGAGQGESTGQRSLRLSWGFHLQHKTTGGGEGLWFTTGLERFKRVKQLWQNKPTRIQHMAIVTALRWFCQKRATTFNHQTLQFFFPFYCWTYDVGFFFMRLVIIDVESLICLFWANEGHQTQTSKGSLFWTSWRGFSFSFF